MTYKEFYEQMLSQYADEKGIVRGEPVMRLYRISRLGEQYGYDSEVDAQVFETFNKKKTEGR